MRNETQILQSITNCFTCLAEAQPKAAKSYDYRDEQLYWEGPPHRGDLAINIALGTTLLWLPLTFAALGRGIFVNYKFTDRRLTVSTSAPWKSVPLDCCGGFLDA